MKDGEPAGSPSPSRDGKRISFGSFSTEIAPGDLNAAQDVFILETETNRITSVTIENYKRATVVGESLTIASTIDAKYSVEGFVDLRNTLFTKERLVPNPLLVSLSQSLRPSATDDRTADLQQVSGIPPIHKLLEGNPAIDSATSSVLGTVDQLGNVRYTPDVGAVEAVYNDLGGVVFVDTNRNQRYDSGEQLLEGIRVSVTNHTAEQPLSTAALSDNAGRFSFSSVKPGRFDLLVDTPEGLSFSRPTIRPLYRGFGSDGKQLISWDGRYSVFMSSDPNLVVDDLNSESDIFVIDRVSNEITRVSVSSEREEGDSWSLNPVISGNGRFVAFESYATNLVSSDTNNAGDIFVHDRETGNTERISVLSNGAESFSGGDNPTISFDGRFVAFHSWSDIVPSNDTRGLEDVFLYDRESQRVRQVSSSVDGSPVNGHSVLPSMNRDGSFIAVYSSATNLVADDAEDFTGLFLFNSSTNTISRITKTVDGQLADGDFSPPVISGDGQTVIFTSSASNLVVSDTNGRSDLFIYDVESDSITSVYAPVGERESLQARGDEISVSDDGRYVLFSSGRDDIVEGDTNEETDVFVFDRTLGVFRRVSVAFDGSQALGHSNSPQLSGDGSIITFYSAANNLLEDASTTEPGVFLRANPLGINGVSLTVGQGANDEDLDLGLIAESGSIKGTVVWDSVPNSARDLGESPLSQWTVFLDDNDNQILDEFERFAITDTDGRYEFLPVDGLKSYSVVVSVKSGWKSTNDGLYGREVVVSAGELVERVDFFFVVQDAEGQSSNSVVSGRVFQDVNSDGIFNSGLDIEMGSSPVFFDSTGDREHTAGADEPIVTTRADGTFEFTGQPSRIVTVRLELDENWVLENPVGNRFDTGRYDLFSGVTAFTTISEATHADFNADGYQDLVVALSEGNSLAIRMNDQEGGFGGVAVDVTLGKTESQPGTSFPIAIQTGQFNDDPRTDVAIAGQSGGNVLVLLDYDKDTGAFLSRQSIDVGENPIDLVSGDFDNDSFTDLAVLHLGTSELTPGGYVKLGESFQVLLGNGDGTFDAQAEVTVSGDDPTAIATADFTGDGVLDLAVLHRTPTLQGTPSGDVAIFSGDVSGQFTETDRELVEGGPLAMVTGDFTGDGIVSVRHS